MKIKQASIGSIEPYHNNPRRNDAAVTKVANSIKEFGFRQPIVVDKHNVIIVGHTRWKAAQVLGLTQVPVHVADLSPEQAKAYRIADNRTNEEAGWNWEALAHELLDLEGFDLSLTALDKDEIEKAMFYLEDSERETEEDDVPTDIETRTNKGDVWVLGKHRLVCGDSSDPLVYKKLLGDEFADLMWTDPPYNVAYTRPQLRDYGSKHISEKWGYKQSYAKASDVKEIPNDEMSSAKFKQFLLDTIGTAGQFLKKGGVFYSSYSEAEGVSFREAFNTNNFVLKQTIVWVKSNHVFGRQDYNHKYEPILYGWKEGAGHYWSGDFTQTTVLDDRPDLSKMTKKQLIDHIESVPVDVIDIPQRSKNALHPTMKPVELIRRQIESSSRAGELVLDPFAGSGSTLIAAHNTGRYARLIELDEKYCDVIVQRWEDHTGGIAEKQ